MSNNSVTENIIWRKPGFREELTRKLAEQARLPTTRYRIDMRAYESGFPRMSLLGFSVNGGNSPPDSTRKLFINKPMSTIYKSPRYVIVKVESSEPRGVTHGRFSKCRDLAIQA